MAATTTTAAGPDATADRSPQRAARGRGLLFKVARTLLLALAALIVQLPDVPEPLPVNRKALAGIALAMLLLLCCLPLTLRALTRRPRIMARWFRLLCRVGTALFGTLCISEGIGLCLVAPAAGLLMPIIALIGLCLLCFGAVIALAGWDAGFEPLCSDGVLAAAERMPQLHARVRRVAAQLGATAPQQILLGLRPAAFVTIAPIRLLDGTVRGGAYTLCLPAIALRTFTETELDALIGHELGHFRAPDATRKRAAPLLPGLRGLQWNAAGGPKRLRRRLGALVEIARSALTGLTRHRSAAAHRRAELEADRAGAQVSGGAALISQLVKLTVLELPWARLLAQYRRRARDAESCGNLVADHMLVAQQYAVRLDPTLLRKRLAAERTEPLDSHPSLAERAAALGVRLEAVIPRALAELEQPREMIGLTALEEELTALEMQLARAQPLEPPGNVRRHHG